MRQLPVIDARPLLERSQARAESARALASACRDTGFFYLSHVDAVPELEAAARAFFALPLEEKLEIRMERGGRAWRGYFPVGGELTSGKPDLKEGIYFGAELPSDDPRVRRGLPLHGANLFPARPAELRACVSEHMARMTRLGHAVMEGIALSLGLEATHFAPLLREPTTLFRIFNYPPDAATAPGERWGVGEHTDYGVLTLLLQDDCGGLQVKTREGWLEAEPIPGTLVCNIGDMLERMTGGIYRSTLHRVRNPAGRDRLSFPFFFDPSWDAHVEPIALPASTLAEDRATRWDGQSVFEFKGTYGEYLLGKVGKVFPDLMKRVRD